MRDWGAATRRAFGELRRRRVFRTLAVYVVVGWLLIQVGDATFEPLGFPAWTMKLLIVLLALGFVLALALAWVYDLGVHGIERTEPIAQAAPAAPTPPDASVAILPFTDLSEARDQDYFCDGLAEEILNALTAVSGLRVASRTSSFRFRDSTVDAREIGSALNVAAILEGSVRKVGQRVRVTVQLIDAGNGYHLWSENFDRAQADIFAIQEEIARSIVRALRVTLKTPEVLDLGRYAPCDLRAYDFYLRGRQMQTMKSTGTWEMAPEMFRRAIEIDPGYAQGHAGLADALAHLLLWRQSTTPGMLDEATQASRRALELAPELAEAHVAHGNTLSLARDFEGAIAAFERAISLNDELYEAHYYLARTCFAHGEFARAVEEFEAAHRVRPDEFQALTLAVGAADAMGDPARAVELARQALVHALAEAECDPENERARYLAGGLQLRLGDKEGGRRNVEAALRLRPDDYGTLYNSACFYALAGETGRALDLLDRAVSTGQGFRDWIEHDGDFKHLRELPRFREILARLEPTPWSSG